MTNFTLPTDFSNILGQGLVYQDACLYAFEQFKILTMQSSATLQNSNWLGLLVAGLAFVILWLVFEVKKLQKTLRERGVGAPERGKTGVEPPLIVDEKLKFINDVNA